MIWMILYALYLLRFIQWNNSISLKTIKLERKDDKILFMKMTKMCGFIKQRFTCKCLKITTFKQTSYRWHAHHTGDMAQFILQALSTRETVCMRMSRASIGVAMNVDMYAPGVHLPNQNVSNQNFRVNINLTRISKIGINMHIKIYQYFPSFHYMYHFINIITGIILVTRSPSSSSSPSPTPLHHHHLVPTQVSRHRLHHHHH